MACRGGSIYVYEIRHKGTHHPGLHGPIVDRELWEKTQLLLRSHAVRHASRLTKSVRSPLAGKLFDESGLTLTPSHGVKSTRRYRYYVSRSSDQGRTPGSTGHGWRLPAPEIERSAAAAVREMLSDQTAIATSAQAIGLAENRLPSMFSVAEEWKQRLQSEVEAAIYMAEAGPVPHQPQDGKVVSFGPKSTSSTEVASTASLLVDVEFGRGRQLYALS